MKTLVTIATIAFVATLAPIARAEVIQIQYQVNGGAVTTCVAALPGPVACVDVAGPPTKISGLGANSNSPGSATLADITAADVDLLNNSGATETLTIAISANDFTLPTAPPTATLFSHIGGTVITGGASNLLSFESCVDPTNGLRAVSSAISCPAGQFASGLSAPSLTGVGVFDDDKQSTIGSLSGMYSISEVFSITLAANSEINWSASTSLAAGNAVPEPTSILLLGTGVLGVAAVLRKRLVRNLFLRNK